MMNTTANRTMLVAATPRKRHAQAIVDALDRVKGVAEVSLEARGSQYEVTVAYGSKRCIERVFRVLRDLPDTPTQDATSLIQVCWGDTGSREDWIYRINQGQWRPLKNRHQLSENANSTALQEAVVEIAHQKGLAISVDSVVADIGDAGGYAEWAA